MRNASPAPLPLRSRSLAVLAVLAALCLAASGAAAQQGGRTDDSGWDTTLARGDAYDLVFETSEGTFMSLDVSPDGSALVFDLLGHIYRMPISGGQAESLTQDSGVAMNYHPRWSPDGETIAFVSDRGGQSNLWLMDADGGNPRAVHQDPNARVATPAWLPNGQGIVARSFTLSQPRRSGLYLFHPEGGSGVELVGNDYPRAGWPAPSAHGSLYFHFAPSSERDLVRGAMQIRELDLETGKVYDVTEGQSQQQYQGSSGGAIAPEPSSDGRWLAFARRIPGGTISFKGHRFGPRTALFLRDLQTGAERLLADPIETDAAEGMKTERVLPGYSWTPEQLGALRAARRPDRPGGRHQRGHRGSAVRGRGAPPGFRAGPREVRHLGRHLPGADDPLAGRFPGRLGSGFPRRRPALPDGASGRDSGAFGGGR